jgi:urocanate hydratase
LSTDEKKLALHALRYFDAKYHTELIPEFKVRISQLLGLAASCRLRQVKMRCACKSKNTHSNIEQTKTIMLMISEQSGLCSSTLHELITYGGNGAVFQSGLSIY